MDRLDIALKTELINFKVACDERDAQHKEDGRAGMADLSGIYNESILIIKGLCSGEIDVEQYLGANR